jgi:hypothetical protein
MAEVLVQFTGRVLDGRGGAYTARVCGEPQPDGTWHGWLEFLDGPDGRAVRTERETTQPDRSALEYWAGGLSEEYIDGALARALHRPVAPLVPAIEPPRTPPPSRRSTPGTAEVRAVLDPFATFAQGESVLRSELRALSADHLRGIIRAYSLYDGEPPVTARDSELVTLIVTAVRERVLGPAGGAKGR